MKKAILTAAFLLIGSIVLSALPADLTYTEGDTTVRTKAGTQRDAQIGDTLNTGDMLKTGSDGLAELDQKGATIKIARNTVFTLMERQDGGKTASVVSVALGSIKFRYDKITGTEPKIRTNGAIAGVRGTELTVFSGADGSTLISVDSGLVTVESEGKSVDLQANQAVDVSLGKPPGDPFTVQRDQIDYAKWNAGKLDAMLFDPLAAMDNIDTAMASYSKDVEQYAAQFTEYSARLAEERAKRIKIATEQGADAANAYEKDVVYPVMSQASALGLNLRYSSLAALSLRRFVSGRLYLNMKERYITRQDDPAWTAFLSRFNALLGRFEQSIAPHLVEADI
jgi:hypothetical protein